LFSSNPNPIYKLHFKTQTTSKRKSSFVIVQLCSEQLLSSLQATLAPITKFPIECAHCAVRSAAQDDLTVAECFTSKNVLA